MRLFELMKSDKGIYVCAKFSDQTNANIERFQTEHEIPNPVPADDLHSTIVYSRVPVEWVAATDLEVEAKPKSYQVWDTSSGTKKCLVLELTSDYLEDRFDQAMDAGASYDFDSYKPHVTLSYDIGDFDTTNLPLPTFSIEIRKEHKEELGDE